MDDQHQKILNSLMAVRCMERERERGSLWCVVCEQRVVVADT